MKTVCIYHSIDLDGWMSAAIVKYWWLKDRNNEHFSHGFNIMRKDGIVIDSLTTKESNDELHFLGYNYGQPIPDLSGYDKVIMCDISFPEKELFDLFEMFGSDLIYIDHHISALNMISNSNRWDSYSWTEHMFKGLQDTKVAACELTWKYFFPNEPMPEIVRLLGRYDCFGHKGTDEEQKVLEFQYGARMVISNYEEAYVYLNAKEFGAYNVDFIHNQGKAIYSYLCTEAKQTYKKGFKIYLIENKEDSIIGEQVKEFICINKERFNPINFGIDYHKDGYDGAACFHFANGMWNFSLYNDNGLVDCSVIAKKYGGGGHKGAAGFKIVDLSLIFT